MSNESKGTVKGNEQTVNQPQIDIDRKKWLINYLTNQQLPNTSSLQETVNEFQKLLNLCVDLCSLIQDKRKAAIIYLLLKNKITYFGQVEQILDLNGGSIVFLLGSGDEENYKPGFLGKKGIIRRVDNGEFGKEKKILERNRKSRHQIKRFFCLTDNAKAFYSNIPLAELERLSENAVLINHLHERMQAIERQVEKVNGRETREKEAFNKLYHRIKEIKEEFAARNENNSLAEFKKELLKLRELEEFKAFPDLIRKNFGVFFKWKEERWKEHLDQIRKQWREPMREIEG